MNNKAITELEEIIKTLEQKKYQLSWEFDKQRNQYEGEIRGLQDAENELEKRIKILKDKQNAE